MSRVRVKICGLRTLSDTLAAVEAGADAVGFNFHPRSLRFVEPVAAGPLVRAVPPCVEPIGVFVEVTAAEMRTTAGRLGLRSVQWHGHGPLPGERTFPYPLVAAFRVRSAGDLAAIQAHIATKPLAAVLIDAHVPGQYGGTGRRAPWKLLAGFDPGVPLILAGGLTPENVAGAIRIVRPYAVDVASGVESRPGVKDADAMRRFVEAVRSAV